MVMRSRATEGRSVPKCQGKWPDQAARLPSGRVEWWQQSALHASLAGGPENRQHARQLGIHLRNPGLGVMVANLRRYQQYFTIIAIDFSSWGNPRARRPRDAGGFT
jgi:hypothetical protein